MLHPVHSRILVGAEQRARALGWEMVFVMFPYDLQSPWKKLQLPQVAQHGDLVRGVILAGTNSANLLELLTRQRIPFVVFGSNVVGDWRPEKYDTVYCDDILGAFDVTRYLQSLGHRDIWFVGNCRLPWFARTYEGYRRAMEQAGLPVRHSEIHAEDPQDVGYVGARSLFTRGESVSAIFAAHDEAAQGVYRAARDCGLRIPEDLSVVGCNDSYAAVLHPPLTTIRAFHTQMGARMVDFVLNRIAHPDLPPQQATIPTELIKRESCRAIPSVPGLTERIRNQVVSPA
jgi:LacI family transcriptional regulator, galactose operon repressor